MLSPTTVMAATALGPVAMHRSGSGPAVVLLHANPGDSRDYGAVMPALAGEFTVIGVDWPGYGASPAPAAPRSASAVSYADLLPELLQAAELSHAAFIGNSLGGFAATRLALSNPAAVDALVLVNGTGFTRRSGVTRAFSRLRGTEVMTRAVVRRFPRWYLRRRTPQVLSMLAYGDARRRNQPSLQVEAAIWRSFAKPDIDLRDRVSNLDIPVLLAWGTRDPLLAKDGPTARRLIAQAAWHPFDTGHAPFAEAPDDFLDAVLPFLRRTARH